MQIATTSRTQLATQQEQGRRWRAASGKQGTRHLAPSVRERRPSSDEAFSFCLLSTGVSVEGEQSTGGSSMMDDEWWMHGFTKKYH